MTKEERITEFNDRTDYVSISPDEIFPIKGKFIIEIFPTEIDSSFIDLLIKELNEAKEIMETE